MTLPQYGDKGMTLISHESAINLLKALTSENENERISGDDLVEALTKSLERKLKDADPFEYGDDLKSTFEIWFDKIFNVQPEMKPLPVEKVIEKVDDVIKRLQEENDNNEDDNEDDIHSYATMRGHLIANEIPEALETYRCMDTFTQELLFGTTDEEQYALNIFLYPECFFA